MNSTLVDLNKYLFEELERLNDDETLNKEDSFEKEIKRSESIVKVSREIINNADLLLKATKHYEEIGVSKRDIPKMLKLDE